MRVPILVINRDQDEVRLAAAQERADAAGLVIERVPAVEGDRVPANLQAYFFDRSGRPHSNLLPGEVGCYASHLVCAERVLSLGQPAVLVLEDDVVLDAAFAAAMTGTLAALEGRPWDIVRLSSPSRRAVLPLAEVAAGYALVRYSRVPKKSGAYLLSCSGARKLLQPTPRVRPIDADLRYDWLWSLDTYGVFPPPAQQPETFGSSISSPVVSRRLERGGRWPQPSIFSRMRGLATLVGRLGIVGFGRCALRNVALRFAGAPKPGRLTPLLVHS